MITYPVTPESRWTVLRLSSNEIVGRNKSWPRTDGMPIEGADPDYVYLLQVTAAQPDYDPRLFSLQPTETVDVAANEIRTSFATVARPTQEALVNAENVEAFENQRHYREQERDKLMILGLGVLFRQVANQTLTAREVNLKNRIIDVATRIWKNDVRLKQLITAIEAGQTPDLDTGWEPVA